jgi:hypothetical protein
MVKHGGAGASGGHVRRNRPTPRLPGKGGGANGRGPGAASVDGPAPGRVRLGKSQFFARGDREHDGRASAADP